MVLSFLSLALVWVARVAMSQPRDEVSGLVFKAIKIRSLTGDLIPGHFLPNQDVCHVHFTLLHHVDGCYSSHECPTKFSSFHPC